MTKPRSVVPGHNGYRYNKEIADLIKDGEQRWILDLGSDNYDLPDVVDAKNAKTLLLTNYIKTYKNSAGMSAAQKHILRANLFIGAGASFHVAKPDADLNMPEIGEKLLPFILPKKLRAAVAGDLAEDFRTYATQWGRPYALRWLWWELAGLCIRRFGATAIITTVGLWFRQKLGW